MATQPKSVIRSEIVSGWKDIANYLGKGVRTVQRYEREGGLPVRRPSHKKAGSVLATKHDLNVWIAGMPFRTSIALERTRLETSDEPVFQSLKRNFAEAVRLYEQMVRLRDDLHNSVEMFRASIKFHCDAGEQDVRLRRGSLIPWENTTPLLPESLPGKGGKSQSTEGMF